MMATRTDVEEPDQPVIIPLTDLEFKGIATYSMFSF